MGKRNNETNSIGKIYVSTITTPSKNHHQARKEKDLPKTFKIGKSDFPKGAERKT